MPKLTLILILLLSLLGCAEKQVRDTGVYYVIKHEDTSAKVVNSDYYSVAKKRKLKLSLEEVPPPRSLFYENHNFILFDSSRVFYFYFKPFLIECNAGVEIDYSKPFKLYLTIDSLRELSIEDLRCFLNETILDSITNHRHTSASISSPSDTIGNPAFRIIAEYLAAKKIPPEYIYIRNWTFEEQAVVTAKMKHLGYDPDTLGIHGDYFAMKQFRQRK